MFRRAFLATAIVTILTSAASAQDTDRKSTRLNSSH